MTDKADKKAPRARRKIITLKVDEDALRAAKAAFGECKLSVNTAVELFICQTARRFCASLQNDESHDPFSSIDDLMEYLEEKDSAAKKGRKKIELPSVAEFEDADEVAEAAVAEARAEARAAKAQAKAQKTAEKAAKAEAKAKAKAEGKAKAKAEKKAKAKAEEKAAKAKARAEEKAKAKAEAEKKAKAKAEEKAARAKAKAEGKAKAKAAKADKKSGETKFGKQA